MKLIRKIIALICAFAMVAALAACSGSSTPTSAESAVQPDTSAAETTVDEKAESKSETESEEEPEEELIVGGWSMVEDQTVTPELQKIFDEAVDGIIGAEYTAVKYLGSQVVAGTNHCFLAEITPVTAEPEAHFSLVYIFEGLDGSAKLINTYDIAISSEDEFVMSEEELGEYYDYAAAAEKNE